MESEIFLTQERFDRLLQKLKFSQETVRYQNDAVAKVNIQAKRFLEENARLKTRLDIARLKLKEERGKI